MAVSRNPAALVVGIDVYDDLAIPRLSGSVYDATTSVAWLLSIGVKPERIRLHVSPLPAAPVSGVQPRPADCDSIAASFNALSKDSGNRLYVFLSGHGLHVPGAAGGAIFLARDYGAEFPNTQKNLRMPGYIQWMLSWKFPEQFLFYDACQNPSTSVGRVNLVQAVDPSMLQALPAKPAAGLLACFSAAPGQKAWAGDGQGVLMRNVLAQLDMTALTTLTADADQQDSIIYDWTSGARQLNLAKLFEDVIAPAITEEAKTYTAQSPFCKWFGLAEVATGRFPILDLPPEPCSDFLISVKPQEAIQAVESVTLVIPIPIRKTRLPPAGKPLDNPGAFKGPTAAEVFAVCRTKPRVPWRLVNPQERVTLGAQPAAVVFRFEGALPLPPSGPVDQFNIRVASPEGTLAYVMTGTTYQDAADRHGLPGDMPEGVSFAYHEMGPDIGFDASIASARDAAEATADAWLGGLRNYLAGAQLTATLYPPGIDPVGQAPNIAFVIDGGAAALAGFLVDQPMLRLTAVGESVPTLQRSLAQIERHPMEWAEPGAYRVSIDLPWGRWTRRVTIPMAGPPTRCELPGSIGREPLRNTWLRARRRTDPPPLDREAAERVASALVGAVTLIATDFDDDERVEPFSRTTLPEWDLLFSAGRLDQVDPARTQQLATEPLPDLDDSERDLLLLGLGHAAFAQGRFEALRTILAGITGPLRHSLDRVVLAQALRAHDKIKSADTQAENLMRHVQQFDYQTAPPIILGWTAGLLGLLFAKAKTQPPGWVTQLSNISLIAVRQRSEMRSVEATPPRETSPAAAAEPRMARRPSQSILTIGTDSASRLGWFTTEADEPAAERDASSNNEASEA